jgi:hypothetical protein
MNQLILLIDEQTRAELQDGVAMTTDFRPRISERHTFCG